MRIRENKYKLIKIILKIVIVSKDLYRVIIFYNN